VFNRLPSVLWRCWLGSRKGIRPVKTEWWGAGVDICLERDAVLHMAKLMPLPLTVSCFSKIQIGFTFLVPAHPGSPGKRDVKRVCVCVMCSTETDRPSMISTFALLISRRTSASISCLTESRSVIVAEESLWWFVPMFTVSCPVSDWNLLLQQSRCNVNLLAYRQSS